MIVVSDSSPLITLDRIGHLELLPRLFVSVALTPEVYAEVVVSGAGLEGAASIAAAEWIEVKPLHKPERLTEIRRRTELGLGELSTIALAQELAAGLVLMDDLQARKMALARGLTVAGCVGVLERGHRRDLLKDLTAAYRRLLSSDAFIDRGILEPV